MSHQPKGFSIFFLTGMWERYGFYVIQTFMLLYLINVFKFTDEWSYGVLGSITALSYGNAVLGGLIADRWLGHHKAVCIGTILLILGYSLLAVTTGRLLVFWALACITMGTGLFKPGISNMVADLYSKGDIRRDSGFTYFYVGVNLGIILSEILAGYIQHYFGWHSVFFNAAFALVITLAIFFWGTKQLPSRSQNTLPKNSARWPIAMAWVCLAIFVSEHVIAHPGESLVFFSAVAMACFLLILYHAYVSEALLRRHLLVFLALVVMSTVYWTMYFQMFFSMNLFIDRVVNRHMWGLVLASAVYPSIEALGVIVFGPCLGLLWMALARSKSRFNPSTPMKFVMALFIQTLAFGTLYLSSLLIDQHGLVMPGWLVVAYLLISIGELLVMPIGLAMVGELLPNRLSGVMLGVFFISLGLGCKLAGALAQISTIRSDQLDDIPGMEHIYQHSFLLYFMVSFGVSVACLVAVPILKQWISLTPETETLGFKQRMS